MQDGRIHFYLLTYQIQCSQEVCGFSGNVFWSFHVFLHVAGKNKLFNPRFNHSSFFNPHFFWLYFTNEVIGSSYYEFTINVLVLIVAALFSLCLSI